MRFRNISEDLFASQTAIRVLRLLVTHPSRAFTGRELAAESGTPPLRALEALRGLEVYGVVRSRPAGRSILWTLNQEQVLVPALKAWFEVERNLRADALDLIRAALAPLPFVRRVVLFGSVARGDERPDSDIDLFVLVDHEGNKPAADRAVATVAERFRATFSNPLRPLIYDQREYERKATLGVVRNIEREGWALVDKAPIKTERLDRTKALVYLRKAGEFLRMIPPALQRGDWSSAGLGAVHAVISACDALTAAKLGVRSRDPDHEQVVELLKRIPSANANEKAHQALQVLRSKNLIEYEARLFERSEAITASKQAERLVAWVRKEIAP